MDDVEKELLEATGFKPKKEYPDRQDYLAAIARAVNSMDSEDFDQLSNEAADWFNAAAQALNDQDELPDFDGTLPDEEADEDEVQTDESEDTPAAEGAAEQEEAVEPEAEEHEAKPPRKEKAKKPKKAKKEEDSDPAPEDAVAVANPKIPEKPIRKLKHPEVKDLKDASEIEFDRYGLAIGTKNASAIAMLEKGCRMSEITEALGGTYYNIIRRLVKEGHRLEKNGNGTLFLKHKDDIAKSKKK